MSTPHTNNFCGGNFRDWLEINLLPECNGKCRWCIERHGYHPTHRASWQEISNAIKNTGKRNIILLGGEPLMYPHLRTLIDSLTDQKVWITTNGGLLFERIDDGSLNNIAGINISIHHYDLAKNTEIVGLNLGEELLQLCVGNLRAKGIRVRFNCNLIKMHIDNELEIYKFINFAKCMGASNVRFAELKSNTKLFVDSAKLFDYKYGLTDDPFTNGCNHDVEIEGMPVNLRQMCGLQTNCRTRPENPVQCAGTVLYYDAHLYNGWQCPGYLDDFAKKNILKDLAEKRISVENAVRLF